MTDQGRELGIGAAIAESWEARAKAAKISRAFYGGSTFAISDEFATSLIRAFANSTQDDVLELRLAANVVIARLDRAAEDEHRRREFEASESKRRSGYDDAVLDLLDGVKKRSELLFARSKKIVRHSSRYGAVTTGKPEPFAAIGDGEVRCSTFGVSNSATCPNCSRRAKYAVPERVSWKNDRGEHDERGFVKSDFEVELVGRCGQHARDLMISLAIAELEDAGTIPHGHRFGSRRRGYGSGIGSARTYFEGELLDAWQKATGAA